MIQQVAKAIGGDLYALRWVSPEKKEEKDIYNKVIARKDGMK